MLLTRVPAGRFVPAPLASTVWAFPVIGAAVGSLGAAMYWLCVLARLPSSVAAIFALAAIALITGALHEDGLADTADGFGGGRTRERKLEIMRDSHIGSFGAIALMLSLATRGAAIVAIGGPPMVALALITTAALGRAGILLPLLLLKPARPDGVASGLRSLSTTRAAVGLTIALALAILLLPLGAALRGVLGATIAALAVSWLTARQIGGYTGDVLGATCVVTECVAIGLIAGASLST